LKVESIPRRIRVYVVVPPRTLLLDIAGPIEVLRRANHVQEAVRFEVSYIGPVRKVVSSIGLLLTDIRPLPDVLPDDAMIIVAGSVSQTLGASATEQEDDDAAESAIVRWLRAAFRPAHTLVSICSGALLAGRAGLLDGRTCTTHHSDCTELVLTAPNAKVLENRLFVEDGRCYSSAGVTTGIDLMLHLVSQITDHRCAAEVAASRGRHSQCTHDDLERTPVPQDQFPQPATAAENSAAAQSRKTQPVAPEHLA